MDRLPAELFDAVLQECIAEGRRNTVLDLRLVCRAFNAALKPYACRTVGLDFSRLSRTSGRDRPDMDALQTIGYHCKSIYVDLMVLRDESKAPGPHTTISSLHVPLKLTLPSQGKWISCRPCLSGCRA